MALMARLYEGPDDFPMRRVRLQLAEVFSDGTQRIALTDGTWYERPPMEAAAVMDEKLLRRSTFLLPRAALEPLAEELDRFLRGATSKSTEAAVLREWLDAERRRVDDLVGRLTDRL